MVGHEESRDKHRWGESKLVYMRKGHGKGAKANPGFDAVNNTTTGQAIKESDNMADGNGLGGEGAGASAATATATGARVAAPTGSESDGSSSLSGKNDDVPKEAMPEHSLGGLRNRDIEAAHVTIKLDGYSKQEIRELRRKLTNELEQVRGTFKKVEARELQLRGCLAGGNTSISASQFSGNDGRNNGGKEVTSEVASGGAITPKQSARESRPMRQLSLAHVEQNPATSDVADKGKRTPKANQYYRNSEFVLGKDKFPPAESKKSKSGSKKSAPSKLYDISSQKFPNEVYKQCSSLLSKLMKHKLGWVFNSPVDAEALELHDYHTIIKNPMDLGTVKSKLENNMYDSPTSFAQDIRLTFSNAMTYNPEGHDVHILAKQLLQLFEERWNSIYADHIESKINSRYGSVQTPGANNVKKLPLADIKKNFRKPGTAGGPSISMIRPINNSASRTPTGKKPKAKDLHKRAMTLDEKQKLSANLQNLPADRLELIVQIIKKRNPSLCQQDEEIEVDIDTFDTETLWELDRFVTNFKKSLSKLRKKEQLAQQAKVINEMARDKCPTSGSEQPKKNENGEQGKQEIETGDNMLLPNCPPVKMEKDGGSVSRSSSSSSSSSDSGSSSSDSDSGSSSGSESNAHAPQSPILGSNAISGLT